MPDTILLVDAYSLIYRAFHAIRALNGPGGAPVNAIYGFTKMLRKLLVDRHPAFCAVVYDLGAPQQRLRVLPSYKEQRPPTPPDLAAQLPAIREMLAALRIAVVESEGEEADDLIATLATQATTAGLETLIASSDKDFTQIVGPHVRLLRPDSQETSLVDAAAVEQRYGVRPDQMVDWLSLVGDNVDNIRGVDGVGPKTATALLRQHGTVDALLAAAPELENARLRAALAAAADQLQLNRSLIALRCDLPLPVELTGLKVQPPDTERLRELCHRFGFKSLLAELDRETPDLFSRF